MSQSKRRGAQIAADVVLALSKADLTLSGVSGEVFDDRSRTTQIRKYVEELHTVGMVRIPKWGWWRGEWVPYYRLNPVPFAVKDEPKPEEAP